MQLCRFVSKASAITLVILKMWPLTEVQGDAVDVTFVLLFLFLFFKKEIYRE